MAYIARNCERCNKGFTIKRNFRYVKKNYFSKEYLSYCVSCYYTIQKEKHIEARRIALGIK